MTPWVEIGLGLLTLLTSLVAGWKVYQTRKSVTAEVTSDLNKEAADASDRMAKANAVPRTRQSVADRLSDGSA